MRGGVPLRSTKLLLHSQMSALLLPDPDHANEEDRFILQTEHVQYIRTFVTALHRGASWR